MLGNCEKMVLGSSIANEWPQSSEIDENGLMGSTGRLLVMEKPIANQDHQTQHQQQALKCPRCDSSNTKFCYYNNYSLSQPRHFCKACKRYWTRGGTLRNVPVGGGCRKNKRVKRPNSASASASTSSMDTPSSSTTPNPNVQPHVDHISVSPTSNHVNPLFYGLPATTSDFSLPYPRFNSRVPNVDTVSGYDLHQPQLTTPGIGFSSGLVASDVPEAVDIYRSPFNPAAKQIQDVIATSSNNYSILGSSTSSPASPSIASLLASSLQQQKYNLSTAGCSLNDNIINLQMTGSSMKEVKMEDDHQGHYRVDWNFPCQNQTEQIGSSDPSFYWNNNNNNIASSTGGGWFDPANIVGPSLPSLI